MVVPLSLLLCTKNRHPKFGECSLLLKIQKNELYNQFFQFLCFHKSNSYRKRRMRTKRIRGLLQENIHLINEWASYIFAPRNYPVQ